MFGGISGIHGLYGVSLDDRPQETFNGSTDLALGYNPQSELESRRQMWWIMGVPY